MLILMPETIINDLAILLKQQYTFGLLTDETTIISVFC